MHPKEAKHQRTGTGRLSHLCLADSEILVGIEFANNARFNELLNDKKYLPFLMYPGADAWNVNKPGFKEVLESGVQQPQGFEGTNALDNAKGFGGAQKVQQPQGFESAATYADTAKILMPIIIDATWFCSRKIIEHNKFLLDLPKLSFAKNYSSIFTFKHEPRPEYISTIETCYYLIKELQSVGIVDSAVNPEPLMDGFKKLISDQLRAENERVQGLRPSTHGYDWKYMKIKEIPF